MVSGTFTTLQANEILVAGGCAYTEANPQQWIAGTGYTIPSGAASAFGAAVIEYQIVSSIQTAVTAALDWNANNFMNIAVATFKATAIGTTYQQTFDAHLCEFNVRKLA